MQALICLGNFYWGSFSYQPDENFFGSDEVVIKFTNKAGLFIEETISIEVTNVDDKPIIQMPGRIDLEEEQKLAAKLVAIDPDGDVLTWSTDHPDFEIIGNNLNFKQPPNYEDPTVRDEGFEVDLKVTDGISEVSHNLFINIENVPDALPSSILSSGHNIIEVLEGEVFVADLNINDPDGLDVPTVEIVGGVDRNLFRLANDILEVAVSQALDFEMPIDDDNNSRYELEILIKDNNDSELYSVTVWVRDRDETPLGSPIGQTYWKTKFLFSQFWKINS